MILRDKKIIFIHIPKCGGTSVQRALLPNTSDKETNYEYGIGWCPIRKIHMQHATPNELIDLELITDKEWEEFDTFCIIRNPWERAVSDYYWMKKNLNINDSFKNFMLKQGKFYKSLNFSHLPIYRGNHFTPQTNYLACKGISDIKQVLRLENQELLNQLILKLTGKNLPKINTSKKRANHYSHMFSDKSIEAFNTLFNKDIKSLGYEFEDRRKEMTHLEKVRHQLFNQW